MSDALPMPGKMVGPNNITLKEGYTWEVRRLSPRVTVSERRVHANRHSTRPHTCCAVPANRCMQMGLMAVLNGYQLPHICKDVQQRAC